MTVLSIEALKEFTGEDFRHHRVLVRPRVEYAPKRYRWYAYKPNGDWGFFWEWENAVRWAVEAKPPEESKTD